MHMDTWLAWSSFLGTLLLVLVGLLNYSVFIRQLRMARQQIQTAMEQLEINRKQPEIQLIQRAITETTDHLRILVEKPYLRPYFYEDKQWQSADQATSDEVKTMAELLLNNFASAIMHCAAFPQYPAPGIDRIIMFHLHHSPELRSLLLDAFDRFPLTGLTMLCLKNETSREIEADLNYLIALNGLDEPERARRKRLLEMFRASKDREAIEFAKQIMKLALQS